MNVALYVEEPSDRFGLETLFEQLIATKDREGIRIRFFPSESGDRKNWLLHTAPIKAARMLANDATSQVAIIPDLYPPNRVFPHVTAAELLDGLRRRCLGELERTGHRDARMFERFHPFCFKHDFEVLLLASKDALASHLGVNVEVTWIEPPEDQNHENCLKRIVEKLFQEHRKSYGVLDVPAILKRVDYDTLRNICPQSFGPLADFLEGL